MTTLSDRQRKYEEAFDYTIIQRLPVIVRAEIKNFSRLTRNLEKPYSPELWRIMRECMFSTVKDIEGAIFSYHHGSEFNFILRGIDDESSQGFYGNKVQDIGTTISSHITLNFMKHYLASDDPPDILGEGVFKVTVFALPSIVETVNHLLWKQQVAVNNAVSIATEYEMSKIHDQDTIFSLSRKSVAEKKNLLYNECAVSFDDYPTYFKLGSVCYKSPKLQDGEVVKRKWNLDIDTPDFLDNRDFVMNIIHTGQDVMRPDRDVIQ